MSDSLIADDMIRPMSDIKFLSVSEYVKKQPDTIKTNPKTKPVTNLLEFSRLYKVCDIPIIDFIVTYIFLYYFNCLYFHHDFKIILIMTVPITLLFNILTNPNVQITSSIIVIIISLVLIIVSV